MKFHTFYQAYHAFFYALLHFLAKRQRRERILLYIAMILLIGFVLLECLYMPLFTEISHLRKLREHTQSELSHSQLMLSNKQDTLSRQNLKLQEHLLHTQYNLNLLHSYLTQNLKKEPMLNPFLLMPRLITLSKQGYFTLSSLQPYTQFHALSIKAHGSFEGLKILLETIESYEFISLESITLRPDNTPNSTNIGFELLILDTRLIDSKISSLLHHIKAPQSESTPPRAKEAYTSLTNKLDSFSKQQVKLYISSLSPTLLSSPLLSTSKTHNEAEELVLEAVFNRKALILGKWLQKGESINGYVIVEIMPTSVILRKDMQLYSLSLLGTHLIKIQ